MEKGGVMDKPQNVKNVGGCEEESQNSLPYGAQKPRKPPQAFLDMAGKGRVKGNPNRLTKTMKMAIEEAFEKAGGVDYLVNMAVNGTASDRQAFLALVGRLLPLQVNSNIDAKIRVELPWLMSRGIGKVQASDTESLALVGKSQKDQDISDGEVIDGDTGRLIGDSAHADGGNDV